MRVGTTARGAVLALLLTLPAITGFAAARAEDRCVSWSEARRDGLTEKFNLRPASEIKSSVESRFGGKVVSFQICKDPGGLIYKLAVFKSDGNVKFVTEPAEPAQ